LLAGVTGGCAAWLACACTCEELWADTSGYAAALDALAV